MRMVDKWLFTFINVKPGMEVYLNWKFEMLILEPRNRMSYAMRVGKNLIKDMEKWRIFEMRNKGSKNDVCEIVEEGSTRIKGFA